MKIAISGFQGTGKSTICSGLTFNLKMKSVNCGVVTGIARGSHLMLSNDFSPLMHLEIISMHITAECRSQFKNRLTISDRSILDYVAYAKCRFLSSTDIIELDAINEIARVYSNSYDAIFLTNKFFGNSDNDPARIVDDVSREDFDDALYTLIRDYGLESRTHRIKEDGAGHITNWISENYSNS